MPFVVSPLIKIMTLILAGSLVIFPIRVPQPESNYTVFFENAYHEKCKIDERGKDFKEVRNKFEKSMPESKIIDIIKKNG